MAHSEANYISRGKPETFNTKDYGNATNRKISSLCCEPDVHYPEGEDSQVPVWHVNPLFKQRESSRKERRDYEDIGMVSRFCSNTRRSGGLWTSFGELCRVGTLGVAEWTKGKMCNYVYPKHKHENGRDGPVYEMSESSVQSESKGLGCNNNVLVVDTFVDESVRCKIASSICNHLSTNSDLGTLDYFYEWVAEFGFDHIIVIGEVLYAGLLFLDCYGRVFKWEEMDQILWPLGNSLEEVESRLKANERRGRVVWTAEYGSVMCKTIPGTSSKWE